MKNDAPALNNDSELSPDLRFALDTLARLVERQSTEFRASVLLLSADGRRLLDCAGPSLPDAYREALHGEEIGESVGSCGTAAFRNERVIVTDIELDPLWENYRDLARPYGFASCWSEPIRSPTGAVLGTFALYYDERREPNDKDLAIIEAAAARAGIMLQRARAGADRDALVEDLR